MRQSLESDDEADSHMPLLVVQEHNVPRRGAQNCTSASADQAQEVKYVFQSSSSPLHHQTKDTDANTDYSHIAQSKVPSLQHGLFSDRPSFFTHIRNKSASHSQYNFLPGVAASNRQGFQLQHQSLSLEDVSRQNTMQTSLWPHAFGSSRFQGFQKDMPSSHKDVTSSKKDACFPANSTVEWQPFQRGPCRTQSLSQETGRPASPKNQSQALPVPLSAKAQEKNCQNEGNKLDGLPPRLAPVSGVLSEKASKNLIRPVAFKPGNSLQRTGRACSCCGKDLCVCSRCPSVSSSLLSLTATSPESSVSARHSTESFNHPPFLDNDLNSPGENVNRSPSSKRRSLSSSMAGCSLSSSLAQMCSMSSSAAGFSLSSSTMGFWGSLETQNPSPSDSGVGELEAMLKEREAEILTLRQVMDCNEKAIFQVYEEKKTKWLQDMREIEDEYEHKLRVQQQKANKLEQTLASQIRRLQQEKLQLAGKCTDIQVNPESSIKTVNEPWAYNSLSSSVSLSRPASIPDHFSLCPSLQADMAMKNTEIMALHAQRQSLIKQLQEKNQFLSKAQDAFSIKCKQTELIHDQLHELSGTNKDWSACEESTQTFPSVFSDDGDTAYTDVMSDEEYTHCLERQVAALQQQMQIVQALLATERLQWAEEKNKVVRYQKQLQLNYVQMQRKNVALEAEVEQLTMELESRELNLASASGEESEC